MLTSIVVLATVPVLGLAGHAAVFFVLRRRVAAPGSVLARSLVRNTRRPLQALVPLAAVELSLPPLPLPGALKLRLLHGIGIAIVLTFAWLTVRLTYVLEDALTRYQTGRSDNLRARQVHTQVEILRRVTVVVMAIVSLALILLSFASVRAAGAGLLASAGVVGILGGVAARPVMANVVAGIQMAFSQPIRVDDVVVVNGHWGRVEQLALTYVVIRSWDQRSVLVPVAYFTQQPFENWTRSSADLLTTVHLELDYTIAVDSVRRHLHDLLHASPNWDGRAWNLQVTNLGAQTVQLRALFSARDSARAWDLQCEIREQLLDYLQRDHPASLPRIRADVALPQRSAASARGDTARHARLESLVG